VCSISGGEVTFDAVGSCALIYTQAGDAAFEAAPDVSEAVTVVKQPQSITVTSPLPSDAKVGDTFTPVATSTSGLPVTITVADGSASVCSIDGSGVVTFDAVGSCALVYAQAGDAAFAAAPDVSEAVTVVKQPQSITVTSPLPSDAKVGDTFTAAATSTSELPVTITVAGGSSSVCSIDGSGVVTFAAVGSCELVYAQAGDAAFAAAPEVSEAVTVAAAAASAPSDQSITVTASLPTDPKVGDTFTPVATSTSGLQVTITVAGGSSSVCSISGGVVTFDAVGSCELVYTQAGGAEGGTTFTAAPEVSQTVTVERKPQSITVTSPLPTDAKAGDTFTPAATSSSGLDVTITVATGSSSACSIDSSGEVTFLAEGPCELLYAQTGDTTFAAAPEVSRTVTVERKPQSIAVTAAAPTDPKVGGTFDVEATATSALGVVITVAAGSSDVCSIDDGEVTFSTEGSCELVYTQPGNGTFAEAPPVSRTVTVARFSQAISIRTTMPAAPEVGDTFTPEATASSGLPVVITVAAESSDVCAIDEDGVVTFLAIGECVLLYDQPGDATYAPAPRAVTRSVAPQPVARPVAGDASTREQDGPVPTAVPAGAGPVSPDVPVPFGLLLAALMSMAGAVLVGRRALAAGRAAG
jgi:formylmethanofuran dehydrogenase subunit E